MNKHGIFKKALSLLLCAVMLFGSAPLAGLVGLDLPSITNLFAPKAEATASGTCGANLTWEFDETSGILTISGTGGMSWESTPWYDYKDAIERVVIGNSVTSIRENAFWDYGSLTYVSIGNGVTSIGGWAFVGCDSLESITIPDSVTSIGQYAFAYCDKLENIAFGENSKLTKIEGGTFQGCRSLESVIIPDSVTEIYWDSFAYCSNLKSVTFGENSKLTEIGPEAFEECTSLTSITIPDGVTEIWSEAFYNCNKLESIIITDSVTIIDTDAFFNTAYYNNESNWENDVLYIGNHLVASKDTISGLCTIKDGTVAIHNEAFKNRDQLEKVIIPDSVTSIGGYAFRGCDSLASVSFDENSKLKSISNGAFSACISLYEIQIPQSVETIGSWAFNGCLNLKKISGGGSIAYVGSLAFHDIGYSLNEDNWENEVLYVAGVLADAKDDVYGNVEIKPGTTCIGDGAFHYCDNLMSVTVADSVIGIGEHAFYDCDNLASVTFGENSKLTNIGEWAFWSCKNLTSITIPDGVTNIGSCSFAFCSKLASVTIGANSKLTSIGSSAFSDCYKLVSIAIPDGVTSIGYKAFDDCYNLTGITIPAEVTSIGDGAFNNCRSLTSIIVDGNNKNYSSDDCGVLFDKSKTELIQYPKGNSRTSYTVPGGVISINDYAFYNCNNLKEITISDSVETIGEEAFHDCGNLASVIFDKNSKLTSVGDEAFYNCGLKSITIPADVTSIGKKAFNNCRSLTSILVDGNNKNYSSDDCGVLFDKSKTELIQYPIGNSRASYTVPGSVAEICSYAFYNCDNLTGVTISDGVITISSNAFACCGKLESVTFGENSKLTVIGQSAFRLCSSLTSIKIPDSVTNIVWGSFAHCSNLKSVTFGENSKLTSVGDEAFYDSGLKSIIIPANVTYISHDAFACKSLESIIVSGNNTCYLTDEYGVLYDIDRKYLVAYPCASAMKEYSLPDSVRNDVHFDYCSNLETIYIPKNANAVYFYGCSSLKTIKYGASSAEWENVTKYYLSSTVEMIFLEEMITEIVKNEENDVTFEYVSNFYDGEVKLNVEREYGGAVFDVITSQLDIINNEIYDITMTVDGTETQPSGKIKIKIPLPKGYDPEKTFVYHVNPITGRVENMNAVYEDGYLVFETDHFSYYAIVETAEGSGNHVDGLIKEPSQKTVNYGDSMILHIDETLIHDDCCIVWIASNTNFSYSVSSDGTTCTITPKSSGDTIFTAKIVDKDGNVVSSDTQKMTSKAGLWQKIVAFFKNLFGANKVIPYIAKALSL